MVQYVRNGHLVWPYCTNCGCRLKKMSGFFWGHFINEEDDTADARGCRCHLINELVWLENNLIETIIK